MSTGPRPFDHHAAADLADALPPIDYAPIGRTASGVFPDVVTITPDEIAHAERASTKMLLALAATGRHTYAGTVGDVEVARRRAANRRQRAARRIARKAARR
ncbi:hypothetical protein GCM10022215_18350 [Nocardioides fonticola]|uniref:Uncharacterized protein n=1 Tax=Nocardioides fonticola TaxID=450363 RepID=A0ABP7XHZ8_9ACTN